MKCKQREATSGVLNGFQSIISRGGGEEFLMNGKQSREKRTG